MRRHREILHMGRRKVIQVTEGPMNDMIRRTTKDRNLKIFQGGLVDTLTGPARVCDIKKTKPQLRKLVAEIKDDTRWGFVVDVKTQDGRVVAEDVKVTWPRKKRIYDEKEDLAVVLSVQYRLTATPRLELGKRFKYAQDPAFRKIKQEEVPAVVDVLLNGWEWDRYDASVLLNLAVHSGVDLKEQVSKMAGALTDESEMVRIQTSTLFYTMVAFDTEISEAEPQLRGALGEENELLRRNALICLLRIYWNKGERSGFEDLLRLLPERDRKALSEDMKYMPMARE